MVFTSCRPEQENMSHENEHSIDDSNEVIFENMDIINETKYEIPSDDWFITDTTITNKGSLIYWNYNQDSSWLVYEESNGNITILNYFDQSMMNYTYLLGTQNIKSYSNYSLFQHEWISGCCTPPDIIFMANDEPKELFRIGSHQLIRFDTDDDYCLFFNDTTLNTGKYINLNRDISTTFEFPNQLFSSKIESSGFIYPGDFFTDIQLEKNKLNIKYRYKNNLRDLEFIRDSLQVKIK
jgi:hypothetical protein